MSKQYPGGVISKTAPVPSGPFANSTAPGVWTLDQQAAYAKQGNWPTAGNVDPSAFIENLFQTWLYTGNGSTQTITNGIDLAGKGGLVWIKCRDRSDMTHALNDTARGVRKYLATSSTAAEVTNGGGNVDVYAYNSNGFSLGPSNFVNVNDSGQTFASWTFREQPKFFDVVTYTGNGTSGRTVAHNLGSVPGCMIVKRTDAGGSSWAVYHRSLNGGTAPQNNVILLDSTGAEFSQLSVWNNTAPTDTVFTLGNSTSINANGGTYVAYLFAHDAGGFGLSGTDNVISCGSFTTNGSGAATITLGYEPQWVMIKSTSTTGDWILLDTMRGFSVTGGSGYNSLQANLSSAEFSGSSTFFQLTNTGFSLSLNFSGWRNENFIYIAIRRGPMAVPTTGTSVFAPTSVSAATGTMQTTNFPVDAQMLRYTADGYSTFFVDRLRGVSTTPANQASPYLVTNATNAESTGPNVTYGWNNTGFAISGSFNSLQMIYWSLRRAPGFFDEVCYTGTGVRPLQLNHNLGVVPELMIVKNRTSSYDWFVYSAALGNTNYLRLNTTAASAASVNAWSDTTPTSTTFTVGDFDNVNGSTGFRYVAYLFASCPGVSKVGSYTGTGTTQTINCGFTGGARFVLIKRTDSTGDWYVWDTARGMIPANDPYLLINSTAAEVTGTDFVDTAATGFEITSTAPAAINASGGTFIFLAIA
jgi:hypothetical protein